MRFQVGKKELFIFIDYTRKTSRFGSTYYPWVDELHDIKIAEFTCTEHHKVAWEFDPEQNKKYDGFVFKDKQDGIWYNQYPQASYGQLDDSQDREIHCRDHRDANDDSYTLLSSFLQNVLRGIRDNKDKQDTEDTVSSLQEFYDGLVKKIEEEYSLSVRTKCLELKMKDGSVKVFENIQRVYFEPLVQTTHA